MILPYHDTIRTYYDMNGSASEEVSGCEGVKVSGLLPRERDRERERNSVGSRCNDS